eukprot:TRINITY_DN15222_c0_g1_i1.p1 TRINITY_DN15222_c0_g1~~TRINITY_DN15222_c0_g1_i1.p1  ORF type:complete len:671 (-),score=170.01 TRINITY_DN15222_c0_g1_i1:236-2248(-)
MEAAATLRPNAVGHEAFGDTTPSVRFMKTAGSTGSGFSSISASRPATSPGLERGRSHTSAHSAGDHGSLTQLAAEALGAAQEATQRIPVMQALTRQRPNTTGGIGVNMRMTKCQPRPGMQDLVKIKSVFDINRATHVLCAMIANVWRGSNNTQSSFRQVLPGLARVHVGNDKYVMHGFLLQELESLITRSGVAPQGPVAQVTDPSVQDVKLRATAPYFKHVVVYLKLRWLLRLHSACVELDYKMCSCSSLIRGLQNVALQQWAEKDADSGFDDKVDRQMGCHLQLESVLDDIFDQLQRALGVGWRAFLEYVSSCDPTRSLHQSRMDLTPAQIVSNEPLATMIDTVFVTCFLRQKQGQPLSDLKGLFEDIEKLGLALPALPELKRAQNLRIWAKAKQTPTRQDRDRANKKDMEKLAQLDAVLLCMALELQVPEVMASAEEIEDLRLESSLLKNQISIGDVAREPVDFGNTGRGDDFGPPAARVCLVEKPQPSIALFNAAVSCVHHHMSFPEGIRERIYELLMANYTLTRDQSERLAIAITQNIDGKRLPEDTLVKMKQREKTRLHNYEVATYKDCSHLLAPALVSMISHKGKPAKFWEERPAKPKLPYASAFSSVDFTKSLPDLRGLTVKGKSDRDMFRVSLQTGPLTYDYDLNKMRTTGYFVRMPPLGYS